MWSKKRVLRCTAASAISIGIEVPRTVNGTGHTRRAIWRRFAPPPSETRTCTAKRFRSGLLIAPSIWMWFGFSLNAVPTSILGKILEIQYWLLGRTEWAI
jgi:hypothetical protein